MKSYSILISLILFSATLSAASKKSTQTELYQKLEALFFASSTPYPVRDLLVTDRFGSSPFEGCVIAWEDESRRLTNEQLLMAVALDWTIKKGMGPLDPEVKGSRIDMAYAAYIEESLQAGALFKDGSINLDFARDAIDENCQDKTSVIEVIKTVKTGVSPDGRSWQSIHTCKNGKEIVRSNVRQSGPYLIEETRYPGEAPLYVYCWKSGTPEALF